MLFMKIKLTVITLILLIFIAVPRYILGFFIWHLGDALEVAAGMGAKLTCSAKYVSGFSETQAKQDLLSYSPANGLLEITFNDTTKTVTANMLGFSQHSATFRKGLGCTLNQGDTQHLDSISLASSPKPSSDSHWPVGTDVSTIQNDKQAALDSLLKQDNAAGLQTRALLWLHNGEIVAESYDENITPRTPLLGWSMGKSVTSLLIGRMQQLGIASLEQQQLFPQWANDDRSTISLEQLLRMSSGLAFDETYAPGSSATQMLFLAASASDVAMSFPLEHKPDSHFSYSSGTTNILNRWMHDQLGQTPQASYRFIHEQLVQKLHLQNTVFEPDASGVFVGSSYIYSSARDWARMALLILNNGSWQGETLISSNYIKAMSELNVSENYPGYGYQVWLNNLGSSLMHKGIPQDAFFMLGNRKQIVMMIPSKNMAIIRLGWSSGLYPLDENFSPLVNWNS